MAKRPSGKAGDLSGERREVVTSPWAACKAADFITSHQGEAGKGMGVFWAHVEASHPRPDPPFFLKGKEYRMTTA